MTTIQDRIAAEQATPPRTIEDVQRELEIAQGQLEALPVSEFRAARVAALEAEMASMT